MDLLCPECHSAWLMETIYIITPDFPVVAGYECPSCKYYVSLKEMDAIQAECDMAQAEHEALCGAGEDEAEAEARYREEMQDAQDDCYDAGYWG